jgi:uncharacterized protein (DUF1810 family)
VADPFHLQRFLDAQAEVYDKVLSELRSGRKTSHWMWFIFPQLRGLGHSATAEHFALRSLDEARAYLAHVILGPRLRECTALVNQMSGRSIEQIFGFPDHLKFRSSMTLFLQASSQERRSSDRPADQVSSHSIEPVDRSELPGSSSLADHQLFSTVLAKYCRAEPDPLTLSLLKI